MRDAGCGIVKSPEVLGGTPVLSGTRVPVQTFVEYLEAGGNVDQFLDDFPTVQRGQVLAVLEQAKDLLLAAAK